MTYLRILLAWALFLGSGIQSFANFAMSPSGTTTAFAIDGSNQGTSLCAAASTECPAAVPINTAGAPLFTSSAPGIVSILQGGNTAVVKAASTAAAAADPSLVTNESPNSQLSTAVGAVGNSAGCLSASNNTWMSCAYQFHQDLIAPIPVQPAASTFIGNTGDIIVTPSTNFTRPANTTPYASGQLVANSTTAASVTPMSWTAARVNAGNFYVRRFRMTLSSKSVTNTSFRLHLFTVTPATITNGDGGTFSVTEANEFCEMDTSTTIPVAGADVSILFGIPSSGDGNECNVVAAGGTQLIYGLLEARAAYTPASGETITVIPEIHQN